jgi:hypothetical protein
MKGLYSFMFLSPFHRWLKKLALFQKMQATLTLSEPANPFRYDIGGDSSNSTVD